MTSIRKSGGLVIGGGEYDSISVSGGLVCSGSLKVGSLSVSGGITVGGNLIVEETVQVSGGVTVSGTGNCGSVKISGGASFNELVSNNIHISGGLNAGRIECNYLKVSGSLRSRDVKAIREAYLNGKINIHGDLESEDIHIEFSNDSEVKGDVIGSDIMIKPATHSSGGYVVNNCGIVSGSCVNVGGSGNVNITTGPYGTSAIGDIVVQGLGDKIILNIAGRKHVLPAGQLHLNASNNRVDVRVEGEHHIFDRKGDIIGGDALSAVPNESKISPWRFHCENILGKRNVELTNITAKLVKGLNIKTPQGCDILEIERT